MESPAGIEVSPLVSYAGEGLESVSAGKTFRETYDVYMQVSSDYLLPQVAQHCP